MVQKFQNNMVSQHFLTTKRFPKGINNKISVLICGAGSIIPKVLVSASVNSMLNTYRLFSFSGVNKDSDRSEVDKFTCMLTRSGKKSKAERIIQEAFRYLRLAETHSKDKYSSISPYSIFIQALENVKPLFELRKVRVSGAIHQIPALIKQSRQEGIALRWIVQATRAEKKTQKSRHKPFSELLAKQLLDASCKKGEAFLKKQTVHKIGESNRAFARSRWW